MILVAPRNQPNACSPVVAEQQCDPVAQSCLSHTLCGFLQLLLAECQPSHPAQQAANHEHPMQCTSGSSDHNFKLLTWTQPLLSVMQLLNILTASL